jgi:hypothetical protein
MTQPPNTGEDRSFDPTDGQVGADEDAPMQSEPAEGTSGSTGASKAPGGGGDAGLGTAGLGGSAAGDQQTEVGSGGRQVQTGQG